MFRIVTDTSANLPTDYLHAEQITVIPYTFQSGKGEQSCMDLTTFDAKDFYAQMRSGVKVTTSQIPPQRYIDVLTPLLEAGEDVLFVSMSSGISGSYASGQIAARQLREQGLLAESLAGGLRAWAKDGNPVLPGPYRRRR